MSTSDRTDQLDAIWKTDFDGGNDEVKIHRPPATLDKETFNEEVRHRLYTIVNDAEYIRELLLDDLDGLRPHPRLVKRILVALEQIDKAAFYADFKLTGRDPDPRPDTKTYQDRNGEIFTIG